MDKLRIAPLAILLVLLVACNDEGDPSERRMLAAVASPQAADADADALMDWAERAYPQHFNGTSTVGQHAGYRYRHYAAADNYLGVDGDAIAVYGSLTHYVLVPVGTLSDFRCSVRPVSCDLPQIGYIEPRDGDYFVFDVKYTDADEQHHHTSTHVYSSDGGPALQRTETAPWITYSGPREGSIDGYVAGPQACNYSPPLQRTPPFPQFVGQTWTSVSTRTCIGPTLTSETTVTGSVVAAEMVATPSGTFAALKSVYTLTSSIAPGIKVVHSCWRSVSMGRIVRCEEHHSTWQTTSELKAYSSDGGPPTGDVAARFNGRWRLRYVGSESGTCDLYEVEERTPGRLQASCFAQGAADAVHGNAIIDEHGDLTLTISDAPRSRLYRGRLASPLQGSGEWSEPNGVAKGSWTASRE